MRNIFVFPLLFVLVGAAACSAPPIPVDPPPVEETEPVVDPTPPVEEPTKPVEPPPEPEKVEKRAIRYSGRTIVATQVERKQIRCAGATAGATLEENRAICAQALEAQVTLPDQLILVIDETPGAGCPTCVTMLAEVSAVSANPPGRVLFAAQTAGDLECNGGDAKLTLADTRAQCYATLAKEGASLRAAVVLPLAIEEGKPCKSCISIAATGYTATLLP